MERLLWPTVTGVRARCTEHPPELRSEPCTATAARQLWGIAVSGGFAQGRVRHVASPAEAAQVQTGEVAVCGALTPGLAAHLGAAAAVVASSGSVVCAGATLLRERGIPTVVALEACSLLSPGAWVVVDGTRGSIWIGAHLAPIGAALK
jgi:phosphohistidine swiveling domain-containing protein